MNLKMLRQTGAHRATLVVATIKRQGMNSKEMTMLAKENVTHQWEEQQMTVKGVRLEGVQAGSVDGPLVILLHGFPEYWYSWQRYIQPFVEAGYRVWVPDQRGYNLSSKPETIDAYTLDALARDITGLMDAARRKQARIIG